MDALQVYSVRMPGRDDPVLAVVFDESTSQLSQFMASQLLQTACSEVVSRTEPELTRDVADWPADLWSQISDQADFMLAEVTSGRYQGLCAIGLAFNKKKKTWCSSLALVAAILQSEGWRTSCPELQQFQDRIRLVTDSTSADMSSQEKSHPGPQVDSQESNLPQPPVVSAEVSRPPAASLDNSKRWLVSWRRSLADPALSESELMHVDDIRKGKATQASMGAFRNDSAGQVSVNLQLVLREDIYGKSWLTEFTRWADPFALQDPWAESTQLGKKQAKRCENFRWFFGAKTDTESWLDSAQAAESPGEEVSPPVQSALVEPQTVHEPADRPCAPVQVPVQVPEDEEPVMNQQELDAALRTRNDAVSISSLGLSDVPVGTDHTNFIRHCIADKVQNPVHRALLKINHDIRVLDGENIGFSYGAIVKKREKQFDVNGLKKAIAFFLSKSKHVIVVTRREWMAKEKWPAGVEVVIAQRQDDPIVLKESYARQAAIVSLDNYAKELEDIRIGSEVREWYRSVAKHVQVGWSWSQGEFEPDYDLCRPPLQPRSISDKCQCTQWAYCEKCWDDWRNYRAGH
eukprot:TRINITY_DN22312_c0_g2_i1.p1 TRINITY_DN22312_c0_g2~~TRINITY_DN22312_c0_g2_i1.p1  ORF type:complete len:575 (-),score=59.80 TRINITY_DN22312_c0_g2_i1:390-2114(-)